MIEVHWNPVWHLGPIPVNWYGLGWAAAFIVGAVAHATPSHITRLGAGLARGRQARRFATARA